MSEIAGVGCSACGLSTRQSWRSSLAFCTRGWGRAMDIFRFCGGPWDGRLVRTDGRPCYFVAEPPEPVSLGEDGEDFPPDIPIRHVRYRRNGSAYFVDRYKED